MSAADYYAPETETTTRARIVGYAWTAGLKLTNMIKGSVPEQILEAMTSAANNASALASQIIRGRASLDTSTDPGDVDPYDASNAAATPARGHLSEYGAGMHGTERLTETFARGTYTITNGGGSAIYIAPEGVTFARDSVNVSTGLAPTYRNPGDAAVYTNPDGTATIAAGASLDITIEAEEIGIGSNAGANHIAIVTSLGTGVTGTNAAAVLASTREDADAYRARCRIAPAILSLNGPEDAYRVIALGAQKDAAGNLFFFPPWGDGVTAIGVTADGTFAEFPNARGTSLGVNRVYVDADNAMGIVGVWYASASGDPGATVLADLTLLINALYRPQCNTITHRRANPITVTIDGTVKAKSGAGVTSATVATAIDDAIDLAFPTFDIGGYDQTAGAGSLYLDEIAATVNGAHPRIYKVALSSPAGAVALAKGDVPVPVNNITSGYVSIV